MKKLLQRWIPIALLMTVMCGTAWAQTRIATVDLRKIFDGYWKTEQAQKALREKGADFAKESSTLREDFKKDNEDYRKLLLDANDQAVSAEEREKRKKAAEAKLKDLKQAEESIGQFENSARAQLEQQNRRMRDDILREIRTVVNARAKSAGYALVLDTSAESANATAVVVFSNGENDITDTVISQLNANAPVETKKPAEKKDEKPAK